MQEVTALAIATMIVTIASGRGPSSTPAEIASSLGYVLEDGSPGCDGMTMTAPIGIDAMERQAAIAGLLGAAAVEWTGLEPSYGPAIGECITRACASLRA